jgi:large subunit ribosomal protein L6
MSRIGKLPISIPANVTVTVSDNNVVTVKGPKGELTQPLDPDITISVEDGTLTVQRPSDQKRHKALHGLYRSLINNMVVGVSEGFKIVQELVGVGYKASHQGQLLELALGYSHNIFFELPAEVKVNTITERGKNPTIELESHDKQLLGQVAAKIRSLRKPEPYKGKGIRFRGEEIRRKAGKAAAAK